MGAGLRVAEHAGVAMALLLPALDTDLPRLPSHPCVPSVSLSSCLVGENMSWLQLWLSWFLALHMLVRSSQVGRAKRDLCQQVAALVERKSRGVEVFWRFSGSARQPTKL